MTIRSLVPRLLRSDRVNFVLTNRLPRALATQFMGWFSKIEQPLVCGLSIALWRRFADLNLEEARKQRFRSMHDCFTRELKSGARVIDPDPAILVSPCDAIVGACGSIDGDTLIQAKGSTYTLQELLLDRDLAHAYRDGCYATLRITSSMYHRYHAPHDGRIRQVTYVAGDTWNVNPPALARVRRLFCKNERALLHMVLERSGHGITLVPVAAILVASIRLHFLDVLLHMKRRGPNVIACDARLGKGEEMGWFQHGSTIIVIAPNGFALSDGVWPGHVIRVGQPLMRLP